MALATALARWGVAQNIMKIATLAARDLGHLFAGLCLCSGKNMAWPTLVARSASDCKISPFVISVTHRFLSQF